MNLFLDDCRNPSSVGLNDNEWITIRTAKEAFELIKHGNIVDLSLDHDLGMEIEKLDGKIIIKGKYTEKYNGLAPTGLDLCKWMAEQNIWPSGQIYIHSSNPVGRENMKQLIDRYRSSVFIEHDDP